jgi:hypothetical protein
VCEMLLSLPLSPSARDLRLYHMLLGYERSQFCGKKDRVNDFHGKELNCSYTVRKRKIYEISNSYDIDLKA